MRPRGRPPLARAVHPLHDRSVPLPPAIALDTSFVVEALIGSQPLHDDCLAFLVRMAEEGSEIVFSRLLELELRETAFQLALKERHPRDWKRFRNDGRARPRAARLMAEVASAWEELLESFVYSCVEVHEVLTEVPEFMQRYGLASYDAVHAATAVMGPRTLVTIDAGFGNVPPDLLHLYVDSSRVGSCRRRRI